MHDRIRYFAVLVCSALLITVAACDDPSNVGLGVGGDLEGGTPATVELTPSSFERTSVDDITSNASRILAGSVQDPIAGQISASGHFDVTSPSSPADEFVDGSIISAELRLVTDYVYGDTVETVTMGVYDLTDEWPATGLSSDTTLSSGALIRQFEVTPTDSLVTVQMPDAWITENDEVLRDTSDAFGDRFHGFRIAPVEGSGNAVIGFSAAASSFRAATDESSELFPILKTFSGLEQTGTNLPENRLLIQDGTGTGVTFSFTLPDSLRDAPVNRAAIHLPADTTTLGASLPNNPNFVRPRSTQARLLGVPTNQDSPVVLTSSLALDQESKYVFDGNQPRTIFQREVLNDPQIDRFTIQLNPESNTINGLLLYSPNAPDLQPRAFITVTLSQ